MDPIFVSIVLAFFLSVIALVALDRGYPDVASEIIEILGKLLGKGSRKK
jgi:hypothetical protein